MQSCCLYRQQSQCHMSASIFTCHRLTCLTLADLPLACMPYVSRQQLEGPMQNKCTRLHALQVVLEYHDPQAEAHGLKPTEAHLQLVRTFVVKAGAAHRLGLEMSLANRKCLNAGQVVDRTVLPHTTLYIQDRWVKILPFHCMLCVPCSCCCHILDCLSTGCVCPVV